VLGLEALNNGGFNAEAVPLDAGPGIRLCLAFLHASEIKRPCDAQGFDLVQIIAIQKSQVV
jgi:hypothetical protein